MKGTRNLRLVVAALLASAVVLASGCGSGSSGGTSNAPAATGGGSSSAASSLKVGLVTDIGGLNDRGFNHLAYVGVQRAASRLGVQTRVLESHSNSDYIPNLQELGQQDDLIVTNGFLMGDATATAAKAFPQRHFAIIDYAYSKPIPNVVGLIFKEQQAGYLAGYLAGLMTKTNIVSTVGGQDIPPVDHYIAGFQAGAKAANPKVKTLNAFSATFTDQAPCKQLALQQIASGSDIVFQVAGGCGLGALDAAKEKGVWGIGVDADQSYLGSYILTSALKRVDVAVYDTIKDATQGKYSSGVRLFELKNNGVGLGKINPKVPKSDVAKVMAQKQKILAGKISIPDTLG